MRRVYSTPASGSRSKRSSTFATDPTGIRTSSLPQSRVLNDVPNGQLASVSWVTPTGPSPITRRITATRGLRGSRRSSTRSVRAPTGRAAPSSFFGTIGAASMTTPRRRSSTTAASAFAFRASSSRRTPRKATFRTCSTSTAAFFDSSRRSTAFPRGASGRLQTVTPTGAPPVSTTHSISLSRPRPFIPIGSKYPLWHFRNEPPSDLPVDTE